MNWELLVSLVGLGATVAMAIALAHLATEIKSLKEELYEGDEDYESN